MVQVIDGAFQRSGDAPVVLRGDEQPGGVGADFARPGAHGGAGVLWGGVRGVEAGGDDVVGGGGREREGGKVEGREDVGGW